MSAPHPLPFFEFSFFRKDKVHVTFQHKILELRWLYTRGKTILFFWKFVCFMAEMRWVYMIPQVLVLVLEPLSCRLSGVLQRNASYQCKRARNRRKSSLDRPLKRFGNTTEPPKPHFFVKAFLKALEHFEARNCVNFNKISHSNVMSPPWTQQFQCEKIPFQEGTTHGKLATFPKKI